jgi:hypothetical protein
MKQLAAAAAALTLFAGSAIAQPSTTTVTTTTISPPEQTQIKEYIVKEHRASVPMPPGFTVSTGAVLPPNVELYSFPSGPQWTWGDQYRYTVIGDQTVLVDPANRHIIDVIR